MKCYSIIAKTVVCLGLLLALPILAEVAEREVVVRTTHLDGTVTYEVMIESAYRDHVEQISKQNTVLSQEYRLMLAEEQQRVRAIRDADREQRERDRENNQQQRTQRTHVRMGLRGMPPRRNVRMCGVVGAPDDAETIIARYQRMDGSVSAPASDPALLQELQKRIELAANRERQIQSIDKSSNSLIGDGLSTGGTGSGTGAAGSGSGGFGGQKAGGLGNSSWEMKKHVEGELHELGGNLR